MKLNKNASATIKEDIIKIIPEEIEGDLQSINLYLYTEEILTEEKIIIGFEKEVRVKEKTGMVFVDLAPECNWSHPCKYFLYSLNTNKVIDKFDAEFPPSDFHSRYDRYEPFHQPVKLKNLVVDRRNKAKNIPFLSKILINAPGKRYAILFSGMSNYRHVNDLEFLYRTLIDLYEFDPYNIYVLNYDGKINYWGDRPPIEDNWPGDDTPYKMSGLGEGSRVALDNVFDILSTKLESDDLLLIHTNNHGSSTYLCCYPDWDRYFTSDFIYKLSSLPQFDSLIVMMEQCHSGVFSEPIIISSPALKTHFAAACEAGSSSWGMFDFDFFAYDWIASITGQYADGSALILTADTNADNRISAKEAFEYADAEGVQYPGDSPNSADSPSGCGACLFLSGFDICLKAYFDYPSAGWKDDYHVIIQIENNENFEIEYNLICTEEDNKGNTTDILIEGQITPLGPGTHIMTSELLNKYWTWFLNTPCASLSDEIMKLFIYKVEFTITKIIEDGMETPVNQPYPIIILNKNIAVSGQKLSHRINSYNFCLAAITHYALAVFFAIMLNFPLAAANFATAEIMRNISVSLNNQANDPIEFDKDYSKIHDFSSLIKKFEVEGLIPIHIKRIGDRFNKIEAYFNSLDITYNRFYSSLKVGDRTSAKIQKERAIGLADSIEGEIFKMKNHLLRIKKFDEDLKKAKIKEEKIEKALKEVKEKGLSEEFKERLTKLGLNKKMIERINESSKKLRKEDIKKEFFPPFQNFYYQLLDGFILKKEKIKDMKRVEGLSEDALARRLLKEGLAKPRDYYPREKKRKKPKKNHN